MTKNTLLIEDSQIKNQLDEWLLSKVENKNQKEPILQLAEMVLTNYRKKIGNLAPPINLNELGECLDIKIKQILLSKNINSDALLIPIKGGFKIELKNEDKLHQNHRTRYSCAHEMAHTFFYKMNDKGAPFRAVPGGSEYEEILCDKAAAEFLMPNEVFRIASDKIVKKYGQSLTAVFKLKEKFKTSLRSICIRLVNDLNAGWEEYLIAKWNPIFENNKSIKIIGFEREWEVLENNFSKKMSLPKMVHETETISSIFQEMLNYPGKKTSKNINVNAFYIEGINIKVVLFNDEYIKKRSLLMMFSISEYLKNLHYFSDIEGISYKNILIDFNFGEKKIQKQKKEKLNLVAFM